MPEHASAANCRIRFKRMSRSGGRIRNLVFILVLVLVIAQIGPFAARGTPVYAEETPVNRTGKITVSAANVRVGPGTSYTRIDTIYTGHIVNVLAVTTGEPTADYGDQWYRITYISTSGYAQEGYLVAAFVTLDLPEPEPDPDFEVQLENEGFPESYRAGLRALHALHPAWTFQALHTGLDWATVIEQENAPGRSLIPITKNVGWKSTDAAAYDWATDTWRAYDGSSWIMCNREVIAYYMDPRCMMDETHFFQFEALNYQPEVQTQAGVEIILRNTFMGNASFTYLDQVTDTEKSIFYSATFIAAAEYSGVSPYHLAARSRIEVGGESASVRGTFSVDLQAAYDAAGITDPVTTEYDGYYNFYNIGASASTEILGNVRNGLAYAKYGYDRTAEQTATDDLQLISWNDRYRSIVGGAYFIGSKYIMVGQNTLYLQKFDVDNSDGKLYWHQYMGNIEAPYYEASSMARAYSSMGMTDAAMVFILPVYLNMPETASPAPVSDGNPNNWLKTLTIDGYSLTPTFDPATTGEYSLIVENSVTSVALAATPVNSKAAISGTGTLELLVGANPVNIVVTAENGDKRNYVLSIIRQASPTDPTPTSNPSPTPTSNPSPTPTSNPTPTSTSNPTPTS
ncbi:MAG TPA: hypothetical protein DD640_10865, partial [Clostridiales bacterium]|nr:hypothetical protein [Clostridiales bacterium]